MLFTTTSAPASSTIAIDNSIENITSFMQVTYAIAAPILYWIAVGIVIAARIARIITPIAINLSTAWISDQMGYTTGFFIETVQAEEAAELPTPIEHVTHTLTTIADLEPTEPEDHEFTCFVPAAEYTAYTAPSTHKSTRKHIKSLTC